MLEQVDEILIRGIKLAFAKRKHPCAASELWIEVSRMGNCRAIRLLARLVLNDIHGGRKEQRPMVLSALKSASRLSPRCERRYLLFALVTTREPGIFDSLVRLARSGDEIAPTVLVTAMHDARADGDYGRLVEFYGCLTQTFVATNDILAAQGLANQLRIDGHLFEALSLHLWAANRGDFASLCYIPDMAKNLGLGLDAIDYERDLLFALARRKAFDHHDPDAAFWLGCCSVDPSWRCVIDKVAGIRMARLALVGGLRLKIAATFGGEWMWTPDRFRHTRLFGLLYGESFSSTELFHLLLVPLSNTNWSTLCGVRKGHSAAAREGVAGVSPC